MISEIVWGLCIPLVGTAAGAACVFVSGRGRRGGRGFVVGLIGFSAGVMMAAAVWSLLLPATELARGAGMGRMAFIPPAVGFTAGATVFLLTEQVTHANGEGKSAQHRTRMMIFAIVLHNIPEGVAIGIVYAGLLAGQGVTAQAALALSVGIAIQNVPDGLIISVPLAVQGRGRGYAFGCGVLSGAVEPLAALAAFSLSGLILPAMPYLLGFAAGAMVFVVVDELFPEISADGRSEFCTLSFLFGFVLMMVLDLVLG